MRMSRASGSPTATTTTEIHGARNGTGETSHPTNSEATAVSSRGPRLLAWRIGEVAEITAETPKVSSIAIGMPDWPGHLAGQHVDVRLTAEDGYEAQRSYSIASAPEDRRITITVDRLDDGEVP